MQPLILLGQRCKTGALIASVMVFTSPSVLAQSNSWTNAVGGNWDNASSWSLGVPPGSSQSVMFTNAYWKAVVIDSSTVASFPQSLAVNSLTITSVSPSNGVYTTRNTLLLNYAGAGNPLVIGVNSNTPGSLVIGDTNSAVVMFSSGLIVNNALGVNNSHLGEFEVNGTFIQSDNSEVVAGFLDLNNSGTYNLTNGELFVGTQFIFGHFNQLGGMNLGSVIFTDGGEYNLFDGMLKGGVGLDAPYGGVFNQWGGTNMGSLDLSGPGNYQLSGGHLIPGDLQVGPSELSPSSFGAGAVVQTGGTNNAGNITMGVGSYALEGGMLTASNLTLPPTSSRLGSSGSSFYQSGGYFSSGSVNISGVYDARSGLQTSIYTLNGGELDTPAINMNLASFNHYAGTNRVGTLSMSNSPGYVINNGLLAVDQIVLSGSSFSDNGGTMTGTRNLTLENAYWNEWHTIAQFGLLQISGNTNSFLLLGNPCVLQFANSSGVLWSSGGRLTISNWSGSLNGGGSQQLFFGTSASGLTSQQLGQVQFSNPSGLPNGTYSARILSDGEVVPDQASSSSGPVNSWINPASGNWDQSANWSLGVLPNSSQSVLIANSGWKAVAINPSTPVNFPGSMTVSNLFIEGATNTENSLLLNSFGTAVPLTALNGLLLRDGAQILNFNSGLVVQGGTFMITNSDIIQDGGFVRATNGPMYLSGSEYDITNGVFEGGSVSLGYPIPSRFNQYGGAVRIANLGFASYIRGTNANGISLYGGTLDLPAGMDLYGEPGGASYFQSGGTNRTGQVTVEVDYGGSDPSFTLNGGLLADSGVLLYSGYHAALSITQNGGSHVITNTLYIEGSSANGYSTDPATYNLNGGTLSAGVIELDANEGDSVFVQSNATTSAGTVYAHSEGYYLSHNTIITLAGGTLSCSNYTTDDGRGTLNQSGGALVVSNLLDIGGSRNVGGPTTYYAVYTFTGGTLTASNINITDWIIGDGSTNRISNPGFFSLLDKLQIGNAVEQLGRFILASNATIDLAGSASKLSFANSSGQIWAGGATLVISDWNGNLSGGGAEQLKFGNNAAGLTAGQLKQIQFSNPAGLQPGTYSAQILATGEIVPALGSASEPGPSVAYTLQGNSLVMSWPTGYFLQTATNAAGPYSDVPSATSPYTNNMQADPQRYFRLRQ